MKTHSEQKHPLLDNKRGAVHTNGSSHLLFALKT
jgi:hypothetical protein